MSYGYNRAGVLENVKNSLPDISLVYLSHTILKIEYNNFGERQKIKYGNNATAEYTYDTQRRLKTLTQAIGGLLVNKEYTYDPVSNITEIKTLNDANIVPSQAGRLGGPVRHTYNYDAYDRLISANGGYTGQNDAGGFLRYSYTLDMEYNPNHTIKKKTQSHSVGTSSGYATTPLQGHMPVARTNYTLDYSGYGTGAFATNGNTSSESYGWQQPHAVRKLTESPTPFLNEVISHNDPRICHKEYSYDAGGNQTLVKETVGNKEVILRKNLWDEENRLMGVDIKPDDATARPVAVYTYNAAGERTVPHNFDRSDVYSNAKQLTEGYRDNIMLYPSGAVNGKGYPL